MPVRANVGGGGTGSDECSLMLQDVPKGVKAVTKDSDDEAMEGTLETDTSAADSHVLENQTYFKYNAATKHWEKRTGANKNNGTLSTELNCGESYTIPAGHTTGGKVVANSLASQTPGNAVAGDILAGRSAWVSGGLVTGDIPVQGGSTATPTTYTQTVVGPNRYVNGNIQVLGDPNLQPGNIKKGVTIFGRTGTFQGYVDKTVNLYKNGTWMNVLLPGMRVMNGYMSVSGADIGIGGTSVSMRTEAPVDLSNHDYIYAYIKNMGNTRYSYMSVSTNPNIIGGGYAAGTETSAPFGYAMLNVSQLTGRYYIYFHRMNYNSDGYLIYISDIYITR